MVYDFPGMRDFLDRDAELREIQRWWDDDSDPFPLILHGRRRTGKSWLFRRFAHGMDADIFVCDTRASRDQLSRFGAALEPSLGARPHLPDPAAFFSLLFRRARSDRRLAVIDEFPLLMGAGEHVDAALATTMEEELGSSRLKLILCGSQVATMGGLLGERQPLSGRGRPMLLRPLRFAQARRFLDKHSPEQAVLRYSIAGGMPLYLRRLGRHVPVREIVCDDILDPLGPLFNETRDVLAMELTSIADHFSLLSALAAKRDLSWDDLVNASGVERSTASRYMRILSALQLVGEANPLLSHHTARRRRYHLADPLMRFWFRFVSPYQADLTAGIRPRDHFSRTVEPQLADHAAIAFEEICQDWVRVHMGGTTETVGRWWGLARHDLRRARSRTSEEIDIVGARGRAATVVGECRWRSEPMPARVLDDLIAYKIPALAQTGVDVTGTSIVLFSRSGFSTALQRAAADRPGTRLVSLPELVGGS